MSRKVNSYGPPYARCWCDKKWRLHRVHGPAVEHTSGEKHWFLRDKFQDKGEDHERAQYAGGAWVANLQGRGF